MHLVIRSPKPSELGACRMLLPDTAGHAARRYLVARANEPPFILGAASWIRVPNGAEVLRLTVIHTHRRRDIGSMLLEAVAAEITGSGGNELSGWCDVMTEDAAPEFLTAHGFARTERLTTVETGVDELADYCQMLRTRLLDKGGVPPSIRTLKLREVRKVVIADACIHHLVDEPQARQDLLKHKLETGVFDESPVMFAGDELVGFLLASLDGTRAHVAARVVLPRFRGGWANVLLMATLADLRFVRPERIVSFEWRGDGDTAKLAGRFPSRVVALRERYSRVLAG